MKENIKLFLKKHSSMIFTVCGSIGVVTTTVLAVKATPKAMKLIELEKERKNTNELTKLETIKAGWKPYIPSIISGISTISCIIGCHYFNTKKQAALISAYDILNRSYKEYQEAVQETYKLNNNEELKKRIIDKNFDNSIDIHEDKVLFYDMQSMRPFECTFDHFQKVEKDFNEILSKIGYIYLNDLYEMLGLGPVEYGYELGWSTYTNDQIYGINEVFFDLSKVILDDGLECWVLEMPYSPTCIN